MFWLTVKLVYELWDVPDDLKWAKTHDTIYTNFQGITNNIYRFGRAFLLIHFFIRPPPIHPYFCPSIFVFTRPNDRWMGLYIKLCQHSSCCLTQEGLWIATQVLDNKQQEGPFRWPVLVKLTCSSCLRQQFRTTKFIMAVNTGNFLLAST